MTSAATTDPGSGSFPGYSEDAPLDLSALSDSAAASTVARLLDGTFDAWADTAAAVGYCAHPVRLVGSSTTIDKATGEIIGSFSSQNTALGMLYRRCGNRRAHVCPSCSRTYARDTFELIRAGLVGGKTVPDTVTDNPLLFITLTAPSFGAVHGPRPRAGQRVGGRCHPRDKARLCEHGRPVGCMAVHDQDDPVNGSPLCVDCYDWTSAVVWQWWSSSELFRRTSQNARRVLSHRLRVPEARLRQVASLQYAKVAEYQARGLVHFHALARLDGPDGPGSPAPLDGHDFAQVVAHSARSTSYTAPPVDDDDVPRLLSWGRQLDVRVVRPGNRTDDPNEPVTPEQVAGYLAKYATKDANSIRSPGQPREHLTRINTTARALHMRSRRHYGIALADSGKPINPYHHLGKWAHMLGFPGHFSSKSRRYSITLRQLRRARARYQALVAASRTDEAARAALLDTASLEAHLLADEEETTLVIGSWAYQGTGWPNPGDEVLALAAAARAREYDQWRAQTKQTNQKGKK